MKDSPPPSKRRRYDAAFRAEALRLFGESRSIRAASRALNIDPKYLYKRQKEALAPVAAAHGAELEPDHHRRTAPAASHQPAAGAGAGNFKKSYRQRLLCARALADTGPNAPIPFQRGHYLVRRLCQPSYRTHQQLFQLSALNCPA